MSNKATIISTVRGGKLQPSKSKEIVKYIQSYEGKTLKITIEKLSAKRSVRQNAYIHVLFTAFKDGLNDLGNTFSMEQVKALCKLKFAQYDVVDESTGEVIGQDIKHTSDMTKEELNVFFEKVIIWAKDDFNITLFYPNEQLQID